MKKKIFLITIITLLLIGTTGCTSKLNKDLSKEFKEEYENLNGKTSLSGSKYREVTLSEDNRFNKTTAKEIVEKIENNETFYLYVGDKMCPWCRSAIEEADKISREKNIDVVYYLNIWDDDHNEILRDKYQLDEDGNLEQVYKGTKYYKKLLKYFDEVLEDYTLTDSEGNTVNVGEKRIYAPNYFYVEKGKVKRFTTGYSDNQKDSNETLTKKLIKDEDKKFNEFFK